MTDERDHGLGAQLAEEAEQAGAASTPDLGALWSAGRRRRSTKRVVAATAALVIAAAGLAAVVSASGTERADQVVTASSTEVASPTTRPDPSPSSTTPTSTSAVDGGSSTTSSAVPTSTTIAPPAVPTSTTTTAPSASPPPIEPPATVAPFGSGGPLPPTEPEPGAAAFWYLDPSAAPSPTATATSVAVGVVRADCSGGYTGTPRRPGVRFTDTEVVVTYTVDPIAAGGPQACPGNPTVPATLELGRPIGNRVLVDGHCRTQAGQDHGECRESGGVRWPRG